MIVKHFFFCSLRRTCRKCMRLQYFESRCVDILDRWWFYRFFDKERRYQYLMIRDEAHETIQTWDLFTCLDSELQECLLVVVEIPWKDREIIVWEIFGEHRKEMNTMLILFPKSWKSNYMSHFYIFLRHVIVICLIRETYDPDMCHFYLFLRHMTDQMIQTFILHRSRVSQQMPLRGDSVSGSQGLVSVPHTLLWVESSRQILGRGVLRSRAGEGEGEEG